MQAIREDSVAFGLGSLVGALVLMLLIGSAVDILNRVALRQVRLAISLLCRHQFTYLTVCFQIGRIRKLFLEAILRQDMSWYDTSSGNNFASKMTE